MCCFSFAVYDRLLHLPLSWCWCSRKCVFAGSFVCMFSLLSRAYVCWNFRCCRLCFFFLASFRFCQRQITIYVNCFQYSTIVHTSHVCVFIGSPNDCIYSSLLLLLSNVCVSYWLYTSMPMNSMRSTFSKTMRALRAMSSDRIYAIYVKYCRSNCVCVYVCVQRCGLRRGQ